MNRKPSQWDDLVPGSVIGVTIQIGDELVLPACIVQGYLCVLVDDSFLVRNWLGTNKLDVLRSFRDQGFEVKELKLYVLSH